MKITIRPQKVSDAKRFFEILNNPNFIYFTAKPKTVEEEREFLKQNAIKKRKNIAYNYSIILDKKVIGGIGVKIHPHQKHIGEIGYFLDEEYWGKGITTKAVKLIEKECFKELKLKRLEIIMDEDNKASKKIAKKRGYKKEGLMKKFLKGVDGKLKDAYLYAKVK